MNINPQERHDTKAAVVLAAFVALAAVGALIDATGHPVLVGLGLLAMAALVSAARGITRRIRERRDDAEDAVAAAAWRAQHMPHLEQQDRAGVA